MMISAENGFINQDERYCYNNAGRSLKKYTLLKKGELAYNHGASKIRPYGSCFVLNSVEEARVPFVYHTFAVIEDNPEFLAYLLNRFSLQNQLKKLVTSTARMDGLLNISFKDYTSLEIALPSKEEQNTIAKFFKSLDRLITLHQRKVDRFVNLKETLLKKLFPKLGEKTPELRFPGFKEVWEQRKVKDLAKENFGGGTPKTSVSAFWSGNIPWIQSSDLEVGKLFGIQPRKHITDEAIKQSATKLVPENSLAIVLRVGVGKLAFMPFAYCTSQDFLSLSRLNEDPKFIAYALHKKIQKETDQVQGTSIKGITKEEFLSKTILVPPQKEEQKQIGDFFHRLDNLITLHQRKVSLFKALKDNLLYQMFV